MNTGVTREEKIFYELWMQGGHRHEILRPDSFYKPPSNHYQEKMSKSNSHPLQVQQVIARMKGRQELKLIPARSKEFSQKIDKESKKLHHY